MDTLEQIIDCYKKCFSGNVDNVTALPRSGSDRRYFRICSGKDSILGVYNPIKEENDAFVGFSRHFAAVNLPVPEVYYYLPEQCIYFLQDLGSTNLYAWLQNKPAVEGFDNETVSFYKKVLDKLILFQTEGVKNLDVSLCYPHKAFDRQSMMWDVNYFKYMYLKLLAVPFNEAPLEKDFNVLMDFLLEAGQDCFLYRDFQTANIMVHDGEPWFIDYQGGRLGAPQYDVASLLFDAKIPMNDDDRSVLLDYYVDGFCRHTGLDPKPFRAYYDGFCLIRVMQACGAFGFRGLYEHKPTFTESVVPGGYLLCDIIKNVEKHIQLPELSKAIMRIPESSIFISLKDTVA